MTPRWTPTTDDRPVHHLILDVTAVETETVCGLRATIDRTKTDTVPCPDCVDWLFEIESDALAPIRYL